MDFCNTICDKINSNNQIFDREKIETEERYIIFANIRIFTNTWGCTQSGTYSLYTKTIFLLISANVYYIYAMHIVIHVVCIQRSYFLIAYHLQAVTYFAIFSHGTLACVCVCCETSTIYTYICTRIYVSFKLIRILSLPLFANQLNIRRLKKIISTCR